MPTSKLPLRRVLVPDNILKAAEKLPIYCNLRPGQREIPTDEFERAQFWAESCLDGFYTEPIKDFLEKLLVGNRIAVHFQGGTETGTMVVTLKEIYWDSEGCPRITCTDLHALARILGGGAIFEGKGKFWGPFILAIALVHPYTSLYCQRDKNAGRFISTVRRWGLSKALVGDTRFVVKGVD